MPASDVAIIGAGIVGCAAAAFLAEAGARVTVYEAEGVAAAASGRNSGVVQHPLDPRLVALHRETLEHYRALGVIAGPPAGLVLVSRDVEAVRAIAGGLGDAFPELAPRLLDEAEEPALAPGVAACVLATGHPVAPAAATQAFAVRARELGARIEEGGPARPSVRGGRAVGVDVAGGHAPAGAVLVAAGPWTPELVDASGAWRPVVAVWGVTARVALADPPGRPLEEAGVEAIPAGSEALAPPLFSLVTADGASVLGSTFDRVRPDADAVVGALLERGARFVPALAGAHVRAVRVCARPVSADGAPLLGPVAGVERLHVATGHGPWGISLGPASARLAAAALLDGAEVPAELAASRF